MALRLASPIQSALRDLVGSGQHDVASNQQIEDRGKVLVDSAASAALTA